MKEVVHVDVATIESTFEEIESNLERMLRVTRRKKQKKDVVVSEQKKLKELMEKATHLHSELFLKTTGHLNKLLELHSALISMDGKLQYRMGKARFQSCDYCRERKYSYMERYYPGEEKPAWIDDEIRHEYYCKYRKVTRWGHTRYGFSTKQEMIEQMCEVCDIHELSEEQIIALEMIK